MKTPTLDEMKLAVAGLLPDVIKINPNGFYFDRNEARELRVNTITTFHWLNDLNHREVTSEEWLHVCWLVEQSLTPAEYAEYSKTLLLSNTHRILAEPVKMGEGYHEMRERVGTKMERDYLSAPEEERLVNLCRVKFPEMFA